MERLLQRLFDLKDETKDSTEIDRDTLKRYHRTLQDILTSTGQSTSHLLIPDSELNISYQEQFGEHDELIEREPSVISMEGNKFREYLKRAIAFAQQVSQTRP